MLLDIGLRRGADQWRLERPQRKACWSAFQAVALSIIVIWSLADVAFAAPAAPIAYPSMAPLAQYMMASPQEEIALARSAAPPSISADAEILVFGPHGYSTAVKGKNGFVCLVDRAWTAEFANPIFWNPTVRGPDCLNPAAVRGMLPHYLERARWVAAGLTIPQMIERTKAELAAKTYVLPGPGAMGFMMSNKQKVNPQGGHWHPHLMLFVANTSDAAFGANYAGSPVLHPVQVDVDPIATFLVPVGTWSDGTSGDDGPSSHSAAQHQH